MKPFVASRSRCSSEAAEDLPRSTRRRRPAPPSLLAALALAALALAACGGGQEPPAEEPAAADEQAASGAAPQPCEAPAAWFPHSQTPEPDPNQPFASFCDFHQWAWQSFLWLTQTVEGGRLRFETFPTVDEVIAGQRDPDGGGPLRLEVRTQKVNGPHRALDEVTQADSLGVLVDHGGRAVYYSQYVNDLMFEEIRSFHWTDPQVLNQIPPDTEFQTGDVELKASWKIVEPGEDTGSFYVTSALVDRLAQGPDGTIVVDDESPPLEVKVALVGLHVVGWVNGHPEAVWATFEQDDNAPDFAPDQDPSKPVSDRDWTFYTADTLALDCNEVDTGQLKLDLQAQTLTPISQACRQFPHGMVAGTKDPKDLQNLAAIAQLNASVKAQLGATTSSATTSRSARSGPTATSSRTTTSRRTGSARRSSTAR